MHTAHTQDSAQRWAARVFLLLACALLTTGCLAASGADAAPQDGVKVGIQVGQRAPDFELEDLNGQEVKLSDYRGQVVLINFWATWCGYCRTEFPVIQAAYESNHEKGFVVLALNVQDREQSVRAYAQELGLTFPVLLDPLGRASGSYRARGLPTSYFVDQEGIIVFKKVGPIDASIIDGVLTQAGVN